MRTPYLKTPEPTTAPPARTGEWPTSPAAPGKFYAVKDPVHAGHRLCVMQWESWVDVGTILKKNEQVMKAQNGKIIEMKATIDALAAQLRDANERLRNLRRVRRKEMRADLEKEAPELAAADKGAIPPKTVSYL